ncbi:uncharacterized protein [Manis javanica]|uniref:uncharacterized protein n=1 Tax=Manis javanica TaxID=9974 RepID=UPI00187B014E|nr:ankyrin repeat domain-containing protein 26 [Manis javanica]
MVKYFLTEGANVHAVNCCKSIICQTKEEMKKSSFKSSPTSEQDLEITSVEEESPDGSEYIHPPMKQELEENVTRELKEVAAEFESKSCIAAPLGSMDGLTPIQALLLKMSQHYAQILRKNYMI